MLALNAYSKICIDLQDIAGEDGLIIVYGTPKAEYNHLTDLDICVFKPQLSNADKIYISNIVERFHIDNNLKIDSDMRYIRKTSFDEQDFIALETTPPFDFSNDRLIFNKVLFSRSFLDSEKMRLRLFLNIFTTKTILVYGKQEMYEDCIARMYDILLSYIIRTSDDHISLQYAIDLIFGKPKNYKEYLGYNKNDVQQREYIINKLTEAWKKNDYESKKV